MDFISHFGKICDNTGILSNLTDGGDGTSGYHHSDLYKKSLQKKLYQYDLDGNFLKEWVSLKSVIEFFGISGGAGIRYSIKTGSHCCHYLWSYEKKEKLPKHNDKNRPKYFYSIYNGDNLIKSFNNDNEIEDFFKKKCSKGNISQCCNGKIKTYLKYKWKKTIISE